MAGLTGSALECLKAEYCQPPTSRWVAHIAFGGFLQGCRLVCWDGGLRLGRSWKMAGGSSSGGDLILAAEEETEGYGILGECSVSRVFKY